MISNFLFFQYLLPVTLEVPPHWNRSRCDQIRTLNSWCSQSVVYQCYGGLGSEQSTPKSRPILSSSVDSVHYLVFMYIYILIRKMGRRKKKHVNKWHSCIFFPWMNVILSILKPIKKTLWYFLIDVKLAYLLYLYRTSFNTFHIIAKFIFD